MEKKSHLHLTPSLTFITHMARNVAFGLLFVIVSLFIGILGYHSFENMSWIDAFVNAAMILAGMGPISPLVTDAGKLFAGFYALFSGLAFIVIVAIVFSPIIHRFFRRIHLENSRDS
jgi:hypothetical protein